MKTKLLKLIRKRYTIEYVPHKIKGIEFDYYRVLYKDRPLKLIPGQDNVHDAKLIAYYDMVLRLFPYSGVSRLRSKKRRQERGLTIWP